MEGLDDAIKLIQDTAVQAAGVSVLSGTGLRNKSFTHNNGVLERYDHDAPARQHKVRDIETLATIVEGRENASVWHADNTVVALLDDRDDCHRDDRISWSLTPSSKFTALVQQAQQPRAHADFVRWLVQNLRDEFDAAAPGLLGTIRNLKFRNSDEQSGNVQQGRESMGRQIEAEISGATDLPETVLIKVRRWASLDYVAAVECLLVLDTTERKLSLRPLADQLEQAENGAQEWLDEQLTALVKCPVHYGTP